MIFRDRQQAGSLLATKLTPWRGKNALVLGLARGGVVVAREVARVLSLPLDVLVVKKIPSPYNPELALGALAPDKTMIVDWRLAHRLGADENYVNSRLKYLEEELRGRINLYRKGKKPLIVRDREVILVDDGVATGASIAAAVKWLRKKGARKIILAVPVIPPSAAARIKPEVKELIALEMPTDLAAVGQYYRDFPQVEDKEVLKLLA